MIPLFFQKPRSGVSSHEAAIGYGEVTSSATRALCGNSTIMARLSAQAT